MLLKFNLLRNKLVSPLLHTVHSQVMLLDLDGKHAEKAYPILASLVTPRPIAWITTVNADGVVNAAPFSFFNVFGSKPAMVAVAPGNKSPGVPKDTARNIRETKEFVINMVDQSVAEAMVHTSKPLDFGVSEIEEANLTTLPSDLIRPPRIENAPAAMECTEIQTIEIGSNRLVIGQIHRIHVRDEVFDPETLRFQPEKYTPIGRMAVPDWYCTTDNLFEIPR